MNIKAIDWFWRSGGYDAGYAAILARASAAGYATTGVNLANQNAGYVLGKSVIAKLNLLYIFKNGGQAQDFTMLNWADSSFNCDYPTAITYNSSGVTGNGTDQYISTNFNCSTNGGGKYALAAACRGAWVMASAAPEVFDGTLTTGSRNCMRAASSTSLHKLNQGSGNLAGALNFIATNEYVAIDTLDGSSISGYNGLTKTDTTHTATVILNEEQVILRTGGTVFGASTLAAYFLGGHLTQAEHATLRSAIALMIS